MKIVIRQPRVLALAGPVGGIAALEHLWNFTLNQSALRIVLDLFGLVFWSALFIGLGLGYLATSIVVGPDTIVVRRWTSTTTIATDAFQEVKPRTRRSPAMISSVDHETEAPWFHPNLTDTIHRSIATLQHGQ